MSIFFLCIKIFFVRIIDVTLGTLRTIITVKDKIFLASVIGFFEVLVWFLIAKEALDTASSSVLVGIFYALGFACGTYIGGKLSQKFIKGNLTVQVITTNATTKWVDSLRKNGFAVSVMDINQKAKELAYYIKGTREFKTMNKYKEELERNKSLKKHLDTYLNKKNQIIIDNCN